jgi:DNA-binding winged helix-turn-helix (wHTH) protein
LARETKSASGFGPTTLLWNFDNSLGAAVRKLCEALRDDADAYRFVETIPRRGYRFIASVTVQNSNQLASPDEPGKNALPVEKPLTAASGFQLVESGAGSSRCSRF